MPQTTVTRGQESVSGSFSYGLHDITYEYKEPGLITYTTDYNEQRAIAAYGAMAFLGMMAFSGGSVGFSSIGTLAPLF